MFRNVDICHAASEVVGLGRGDLIPRLLSFPSSTRLDFTPEYLDSLSTDELRHVLLAAMACLSRK